jgi:tRNA 2-selenouridine synthase
VKQLDPEQFLNLKAPCLDIRSPKEYEQAHIPGAFAFPLFDNEERKEVGIIYKADGKSEAIKRGLELVGPKMRTFVEKAETYHSDELKIYCWRGGMRSTSMGWLLTQAGNRVYQLKGGYKSFRNYLLALLRQPFKLNVLTGLTGSGKTEVLLEMEKQGAQVIDLEGMANHPGSSFGNALDTAQPSTEMFQNSLLMKLHGFDLKRPVWVEDESFTIGQVHMPEELFNKMRDSQHFLLEVPDHYRIQLLVKLYGTISKDKLIEATRAIQKKLGSVETNQTIEYINKGDLPEACKILLTYYDRQYKKFMNKKGSKETTLIDIAGECPEQIAKHIINTYGY